MATSLDFNNLIDRVEIATTKLEDSVDIVYDASGSVTAQVLIAEGWADEAHSSSIQAQIEAALGLGYRQDAEAAEQGATQAYNDTVALIGSFTDEQVIGEAPINGSQYARQDGEWAILSSGGSGVGTVVSVNNISPDSQGDVSVPIPDAQVNSDWEAESGLAQVLNKPVLFDGDYESLTNTPSPVVVPTELSEFNNDVGFVTDAPVDSNQYARKDSGWVVVEAAGEPVAVPFPTNTTDAQLKYDGVKFDVWISANPFKQAEVSKLSTIVMGRGKSGAELFTDVSTRDNVPHGQYLFQSADVSGTPLAGLNGVIIKGEKTFALTNSGLFRLSGGVWKEAVEGGGELPFLTGAESGVTYNSIPFERWLDNNPHTQAEISKVSAIVIGRPYSGMELFLTPQRAIYVPDGIYSFTVGDVSGVSGLVGGSGVIVKGAKTFALTDLGVFHYTTLGNWELPEVEGTGGGGGGDDLPHLIPPYSEKVVALYKGVVMERWHSTNPNAPMPISDLSLLYTTGNNIKEGINCWTNSANAIPDGAYSFLKSDVVGTVLEELSWGTIYVNGRASYAIGYTILIPWAMYACKFSGSLTTTATWEQVATTV